MNSKPIDKVLSKFPNAKKSGSGYIVNCPAHEDKRPSLQITEGDDGKKMQEIRKDPYVCFEVDEGEMITGENPCDYSWKYTSVLAYGKATIVEDEAERLKGLKLISNKYSPGKGSLITEELMGKFKHLWIIRIDVEEMTGKKSPA